MTVAENVAFGLEMRGIAGAERRERVAEALALVGLAGLADRYPRRMSGGQQQRVALARALVIRPQILLLDEPLSNLDAKLREDMRLELRQIQRSLGTTTLLVTHDQGEAMALADRIVVMNAGRIEQVGPPDEVYEWPATAFVASFLGKTNLLEATLDEAGWLTVSGARWFVGASPGEAACPDPPCAHPLPRPGKVVVAIRPEKIQLRSVASTEPPHGDCAPHLRGTVHTRVFQGDHWLVQVTVSDQTLTVISPNTGSHHAREGEAVMLSWQASDLRLREAPPAQL
jgi:putative spermidine/putrescine transport system ATP-binding protein